jgi:hypothetical protein
LEWEVDTVGWGDLGGEGFGRVDTVVGVDKLVTVDTVGSLNGKKMILKVNSTFGVGRRYCGADKREKKMILKVNLTIGSGGGCCGWWVCWWLWVVVGGFGGWLGGGGGVVCV